MDAPLEQEGQYQELQDGASAPSELSVDQIANLIAERLTQDGEKLTNAWALSPEGRARHVAIDGLLPDDLARTIADNFPTSGAFWRQLNSFRESKKTFAKLGALHPVLAQVTDAFHEPQVIEKISDITGMVNLEADPSLYAGGLSLMQEGDFLNPHIDNSHDAERTRYRRLNLLYYVSPEWTAEHGGNLELWDRRVTTPLEITSRYNRLVLMETNKTSWHSVNRVRKDASRCCVSNYYFSAASPTGADYHHVTSFLGRPEQPARRLLGRLDNAGRQFVASTLGMTRGKHLRRDA